MLQKVVYAALTIWVTIEPVGPVLLFAAITSELTPAERRKIAVKATAYSAIVQSGAIVVGQLILSAMQIQLISLELAGGIILFPFGLQMIFGRASDTSGGSKSGQDLAVFPLAVPSIVGPESNTAVVVLTDNHVHSVTKQALTPTVMVGVLGRAQSNRMGERVPIVIYRGMDHLA